MHKERKEKKRIKAVIDELSTMVDVIAVNIFISRGPWC